MKANIGFFDKIVRIVIAIGLLMLYFTNIISGALSIILLIAAAILLITSFTGFCPIWHLLGISTRKKGNFKQQENLN
jgi:hypothetical protein